MTAVIDMPSAARRPDTPRALEDVGFDQEAAAYARAWDRQHRQPGQRGGALGRAALDVLSALLWVFHNARSGVCFPSDERITDKAGCARSTVAEAIKALEWAGVLTWQNRITRVREQCRDLFGREGWRWRVINRSGTQDQEILDPVATPARNSDSPLDRVLARFGAAVAAKKGIEQEAAG